MRHDSVRLRNHLRVTLLAVKLLLAPAFVVGASLAARRFGPRVGGLIAGLPVVAGPILLAYALAHGREFAATAAAGTLLGLVSLITFVVVYGRLAPRLFWGASMLVGWLAFVAATVGFSALSLPVGVALGLAATALLVGLTVLPRPGQDLREHATPPAWDLPVRAACALALVLTLTAVAGWLGPQLSGLLAPFPIIATVLATFTHAQRGTDELLRLLRGLLSGLGAFALFFFVLAVSLHRLDTGAAFALATALALLTQGIVHMLVRGDPASRALAES
jgi:multidrug transporter EmrE-like cation transporter